MRRLALVTIALSALMLAAAAPAIADVHVRHGQTVDELRVIGQDVRVDGHVRGPVLVVAGNLNVGARGQVANVTVIGGKIETVPGARLQGDVFQIGGTTPDLSGWTLVLALLGVFALRTLLVWLVVRAADVLVRTRLMPPLTGRLQAAPGRTLLTGILGSLGLFALGVLAALTVVGLPVALVICGCLIVSLLAGVASASQALGFGREQRRGVFVALAIPVIGDALLTLGLAAGVGALLRWFGSAGTGVESAGAPLS